MAYPVAERTNGEARERADRSGRFDSDRSNVPVSNDPYASFSQSQRRYTIYDTNSTSTPADTARSAGLSSSDRRLEVCRLSNQVTASESLHQLEDETIWLETRFVTQIP